MKAAIIFLVHAFAVLVVQAQDGKGEVIEYKIATRPIVNVSEAELKAYADDPNNKPRLDSKPTGKLEKQPKTAGKSFNKITSQVVGGTRATVGQFPWSVYFTTNNAYACGGSIISPSWVLTAAHCIYGATSFVLTAGGITRNTVETGEVTKTSTFATYHQNYDPITLVNDIGVIKVASPWTLNSYINVIRLPKQSQATLTFEGLSAVASGYDSPYYYLNFVALVVFNNTLCVNFYGSTTITSSSLCTAATTTKGTCAGDSGGPLQLKESDGLYTQIGVISVRPANAPKCSGYPTGYARVTSYLGWISSKTGIVIALK